MGLIRVLLGWVVAALVWSLEVAYVLPNLQNPDFVNIFLGICSLLVCCLFTVAAFVVTALELRPQVG